MNKVLIVDDDLATRDIIVRLLEQLGDETIIARPQNIWEITIPESYHEPICTNYTPDREYGWYRKFEKNSKKRNFKKAI